MPNEQMLLTKKTQYSLWVMAKWPIQKTAQQETIKTRKHYTDTTSKQELNLNLFRELIYLYSKMSL